MHLFETTNQKGYSLTKLEILKNIAPTSVACESAFSLAGNIITRHSATTIKEPPEPFLRNFGIDRTDLSTNQRTEIARFSARSYFCLNLV